MAKRKSKAVEVKEISRVELANGTVIIRFEDGSMQIIPAAIKLTPEEVEEIFPSEEDSDEDSDDEDEDEDSEDDEDEDEDSEDDEDDSDDDEDSEDEEITPEALAEMDYEELEDLCDGNDLDTDPDEFDEEDIEKLRKAIAKELGITLPKAKKESKKKKGKK